MSHKKIDLQVSEQELVEELISNGRAYGSRRERLEEFQSRSLSYLVAQFHAWSEIHIRTLRRAHARLNAAKLEDTFERQAEAAGKVALENTSDYLSEWGRYAHHAVILLTAFQGNVEILEAFAMQGLSAARAMAGGSPPSPSTMEGSAFENIMREVARGTQSAHSTADGSSLAEAVIAKASQAAARSSRRPYRKATNSASKERLRKTGAKQSVRSKGASSQASSSKKLRD